MNRHRNTRYTVKPRRSLPAPPRLGAGAGTLLVVVVCTVLAAVCVHLVREVGSRQDRLSEIADWWQELEGHQGAVHSVHDWIQDAAWRDEHISHLLHRERISLDELESPAVLKRSPLLYSAHRVLMDTWRRGCKELADELRLREQDDEAGAMDPSANPYAVAQDRAELLKATVDGVRGAASGRLSDRARELASRRSLLDTVALIAVLATVLFGLLLIRARSQRRALDASTEALSQFEERYRQMFAQINVPKLLVDPVAGHIVDANDAACRFYGATLEALRSMHATQLYSHGADASASILALPSNRQATTTLSQHRILSGELRDVEVQSAPIRLGSRTLIYSIVRDVTERHRAEQKVRESEERFRTLAENVPGVTYLARNAGDRFQLLYLNDSVSSLTGLAAAEFLEERTRFHELYHHEEAAALVAEIERALKQCRPYFLSYRMRHVDGNYRWVEEHGQGVYDEDGSLRFLQGTIFDVTGRRRAKEALAAERDRMGVTLRSIADAVITTDTTGKIELMNEAAERLLEKSSADCVGQSLAHHWPVVVPDGESRPPPPLERWLNQVGRQVETETLVFRRPNRDNAMVSVAGSPIRSLEGQTVGAVVVLRDVTEQSRREEEMQRAAKLESVGVLAGGIAHDFNNILAGVIGNLSLARLEVPDGTEAGYSLKQAQDAAVRAQNLTRQLLTFAKGGAPLRRLTNLTECIRDTVSFALRGSNVKCEPEIQKDLPSAEVDEGQINQVLHNLVLNAAQAMPDGGVLHVTARSIEVRQGDPLPVKPGGFLEIEVSDEGCGIPEEAQARIFDPYFTTKRTGTGLGLATSYSIVRKHDGCIHLESEPGVGTTFRVYLPASEKRAIAVGRTVALTPDMGNGARILLMDDESTVRDVCGRMLEALGYAPEFAIDGQSAIESYEQGLRDDTPFELVIMDLTVPGAMGGREATARLLDIDPEARIVVSSGYCNDAIMDDPGAHGFSGVLNKPYTQEDLARVLAEQLRAGGTGRVHSGSAGGA